jgi:hypothetical protein
VEVEELVIDKVLLVHQELLVAVDQAEVQVFIDQVVMEVEIPLLLHLLKEVTVVLLVHHLRILQVVVAELAQLVEMVLAQKVVMVELE